MAFTGYTISQRSFGISVLEDGRVLATGGADGDDVTGTAGDGWDLLTWTDPNLSQVSGTLPEVRASHGQTSMAGGLALISGGWTVVGTVIASARLFDVSTLAWTSVTSMNVARMRHELVELDDGSVLAVGGAIDDTEMLAGCEVYDPIGDTWTNTGNMTYARYRHGVVKLPDGRVAVIGGRGYNPSRTPTPATLASCEIYDPTTHLWSPLPPLRYAREAPVCTYLPTENAVYVAGGANGVFAIEILDVATMKWKVSRGTTLAPHLDPSGGYIGDDIFAVIGGTDQAFATEKKNYIVAPGSDQFWLGAGINGPHRVTEVPDGTHVIFETREYDYGKNYNVAAPGATVTPSAAQPAPATVPGPFSYDTKTGLAITEKNGTTAQAFNDGAHYSSMLLDDTLDPNPALQFPDEEGYLVFNFGYENQVGPVKYLGRFSDTELILDAGVPFSAALPAGATVRLLASRVPFEPADNELVGNFYVTGTAAGREAARKIIDDITAAGKQVLVTVLYPGDRGLGAEGFPQSDDYKLSDKIGVWGGDDLDQEIPATRKAP